MESKKYSHSLGGKTIQVEINNWAEQASGSVLVRLGDTIVLATAVMGAARDGTDFFPLTVDYEEKFYAVGKILGSRFVKRETRPSEEAILVDRAIDRSIRPRFDMRMRNEVQVVVTTLSIDDENDPDIPALIASSLALSLSDIPWDGPIAGVRVGQKDKETFILNPTYAEREGGLLDVIVSGTKERINMLEASAQEVSEEEFAKAVSWGFDYVRELILFQEKIIAENGKKKRNVALFEAPVEIQTHFTNEFAARIEEALYQKDNRTRNE